MRIPLELLKVNGLYYGYRNVPNPYHPGKWNDDSLLAVYKGNGEYWTLEYDLLPDGEKDFRASKKLRTQKDVSVDPRGVRPIEEMGVIKWNGEDELKEWLEDYYAESRIERKMLVRFEMDPRWRTSAVIDLCRSMLAANDFVRLPILADALMDAGCDNEELIAACRTEKVPAYAMRIAALTLGDEHADAVRWLEKFGDRWNFSWKAMIDEPQMEGHCGLTAGGIDLHGSSELEPGDEEGYWRSVELLVGKPLRRPEGWSDDDDERTWYWSCSC